jgi:hypothetical protein
MKIYRNPMIGMKVATTWMPPPMPLASSTISHSGAPDPASTWAAGPSTKTVPAAWSKKSMKAPPMLMVNMNIRYITTRKIGMPKARFSMTRSMESDRLRDACPASLPRWPWSVHGEAVAGVCQQDVHVVRLLAQQAADLSATDRIAHQTAGQVVAFEQAGGEPAAPVRGRGDRRDRGSRAAMADSMRGS